MDLPAVSMIAAMTHKRRVIGNKGAMPWTRLRRDMVRFVKLTRNSAVVMGPKTYTSIGKPLKGRLNIIITTNHDYEAPKGVLVAHDPQQALELAAINHKREFFVIGGAMVYTSFLPLAETVYITYVRSDKRGDTHFPRWNKKEWYQAWSEEKFHRGVYKGKRDSFSTKFAEYRRNLKPLPKERKESFRLLGDEGYDYRERTLFAAKRRFKKPRRKK